MSAACCGPQPLRMRANKRERGEITADALRDIEDREIQGVIKKQEDIGLKSITDGEYRRISWNYDFLERLDNVESYVGERKIKFAATGRSRGRFCCASSASSAATNRIR